MLGVAVKDKSKIDSYYARFISYMEKNHRLKIEKQLKIDKWIMPHIRPDYAINHGVGRVLFAGEIAGFLNPMGEGISAGMESGYCAARAIMKHFDNLEQIYTDYQSSTRRLHEYMKRQWSYVGRMTNSFSEMKI